MQETLISACIPTRFGLLPGRGAADALAAAREIQWTAKMAGHSLVIASFDLSQAFYRIDPSLLEILCQGLEDQRIASQL